VKLFLTVIASRSVTQQEVHSLATRIIRDADVDRDGSISFREFMLWPGKQAVLDWLDAYYNRVLGRLGGVAVSSRGLPVVQCLPWDGLTIADLVAVYREELRRSLNAQVRVQLPPIQSQAWSPQAVPQSVTQSQLPSQMRILEVQISQGAANYEALVLAVQHTLELLTLPMQALLQQAQKVPVELQDTSAVCHQHQVPSQTEQQTTFTEEDAAPRWSTTLGKTAATLVAQKQTLEVHRAEVHNAIQNAELQSATPGIVSDQRLQVAENSLHGLISTGRSATKELRHFQTPSRSPSRGQQSGSPLRRSHSPATTRALRRSSEPDDSVMRPCQCAACRWLLKFPDSQRGRLRPTACSIYNRPGDICTAVSSFHSSPSPAPAEMRSDQRRSGNTSQPQVLKRGLLSVNTEGSICKQYLTILYSHGELAWYRPHSDANGSLQGSIWLPQISHMFIDHSSALIGCLCIQGRHFEVRLWSERPQELSIWQQSISTVAKHAQNHEGTIRVSKNRPGALLCVRCFQTEAFVKFFEVGELFGEAICDRCSKHSPVR